MKNHHPFKITRIEPETNVLRQGDQITEFLPSEQLIQNDFPVNWDYLYIIDGRVWRSDVQGTILTLKRDLLNQGLIDSIDVEARTFDHKRFNK